MRAAIASHPSACPPLGAAARGSSSPGEPRQVVRDWPRDPVDARSHRGGGSAPHHATLFAGRGGPERRRWRRPPGPRRTQMASAKGEIARGGMEPWQWPDEQWRAIVNHVRAGRSLRPAHWPDGARCAVALSFDSDHETNELRDGGGSIGRLSWGQYGSRVAVPRILKLLARYDVPASFYVPAVSALLYPDEQRAVVAAGHEVGI